MNLKLIDFREMLGIKYDENSKTILPNHLMFKLAHAKPQKLKDLYFYLNGEHNTHYAIKENYQ